MSETPAKCYICGRGCGPFALIALDWRTELGGWRWVHWDCWERRAA